MKHKWLLTIRRITVAPINQSYMSVTMSGDSQVFDYVNKIYWTALMWTTSRRHASLLYSMFSKLKNMEMAWKWHWIDQISCPKNTDDNANKLTAVAAFVVYLLLFAVLSNTVTNNSVRRLHKQRMSELVKSATVEVNYVCLSFVAASPLRISLHRISLCEKLWIASRIVAVHPNRGIVLHEFLHESSKL